MCVDVRISTEFARSLPGVGRDRGPGSNNCSNVIELPRIAQNCPESSRIEQNCSELSSLIEIDHQGTFPFPPGSSSIWLDLPGKEQHYWPVETVETLRKLHRWWMKPLEDKPRRPGREKTSVEGTKTSGIRQPGRTLEALRKRRTQDYPAKTGPGESPPGDLPGESTGPADIEAY